MASFDSLFIEYYTPALEAPFSYAAEVKLIVSGNELKTSYKLDYLDRDELSEADILEEGADPENSFLWEGTLNSDWKAAFEKLVAKSPLLPEDDETNCYLSINTDRGGFAKNFEEWDYFMQELHQAVLEQTGKEYPLTIRYEERKGKIPTIELTLIISFLERKGSLLKIVDKEEKSSTLNWNEVFDVMSSIYSLEFNFEEVVEIPFDGAFLDLVGEDQWLRLPDAVLNAGKNNSNLNAMTQKLKNL